MQGWTTLPLVSSCRPPCLVPGCYLLAQRQVTQYLLPCQFPALAVACLPAWLPVDDRTAGTKPDRRLNLPCTPPLPAPCFPPACARPPADAASEEGIGAVLATVRPQSGMGGGGEGGEDTSTTDEEMAVAPPGELALPACLPACQPACLPIAAGCAAPRVTGFLGWLFS